MADGCKCVAGHEGLPAEVPALYEIYAERSAGFRDNPPGAEWDGVYVATSK